VIVFVDNVIDRQPGLDATLFGRGFLTGAKAVMSAIERPELGEFQATLVILLGIGRADTTFPTLPTTLAGLTWQVTLINPDGTRSNAVEALRT
jgi:hypothetical protein